MPWIISGLTSFLVGIVYEKATDKEVIESVSQNVDLSWWDKTLLVALGLGALWIYKKA